MSASKFNPAWLDSKLFPEFKPWLREVENDPRSAMCVVCKKKFSLSNMGKRAVTSHMSHDKFLKTIHNVFKESPARRADFFSLTKCDTFPLKFCNCRWLENAATCERALKIIPHLKKYFKEKKAVLPDTYSVEKSVEILEDPLLLPKLHFL